MYVICDNTRSLSESCWFARSMTESIYLFIKNNPCCRSFNVYRDASSSGKLSSCSYVSTFNQKNISSFLSSLQSRDGDLAVSRCPKDRSSPGGQV